MSGEWPWIRGIQLHEAEAQQQDRVLKLEASLQDMMRRQRDLSLKPDPPPTYVADTVSRMANGSILVTTQGGVRVVIPPIYLKDLVALAEMSMLEKVIGPETSALASEQGQAPT